MGMTVGGGKAGPVSDPNIVPLIDVLLVLTIIFMVITPQMPTGLATQLPQPSPPPTKAELLDSHVIVVQVMSDEHLMINQEQTGWDSLAARLHPGRSHL